MSCSRYNSGTRSILRSFLFPDTILCLIATSQTPSHTTLWGRTSRASETCASVPVCSAFCMASVKLFPFSITFFVQCFYVFFPKLFVHCRALLSASILNKGMRNLIHSRSTSFGGGTRAENNSFLKYSCSNFLYSSPNFLASCINGVP